MDWKLAEAKNKLSEVVRRALTEGPQRIRRRDSAVVVLSEDEYERMAGLRKGFKDFLLEGPDMDEIILDRSRETMRAVELKVLLDTCVISEARRKKGHPRVLALLESIRSEEMFLSVITVGELTKGIALLPAGKKKDDLCDWLLSLEQDHADRVLPIDGETARIWGELTAAAQRRGKAVSVSDGLIAATAIRHGIHVVTRDVGDFRETGAMLINPWGPA